MGDGAEWARPSGAPLRRGPSAPPSRKRKATRNAPQILSGLADLPPRCTAIIADLWGTLHNGERAFDGVLTALEKLRARGVPVCLLSNSPRPVAALAAQLAAMGIRQDRYAHLVSSGEATIRALRRRDRAWLRALGRRYCVIGPPETAALLQGLAYIRVPDAAGADFVLVTGAEPGTGIAAYEAVLRACLARGLPMICANPDRHVVVGTRRLMCAGAIAARYAAEGGVVHAFGKPAQPIFRQCLRLLRRDPRAVLMVGDSLETDIAGAQEAGIAAAFIPGPLYPGVPWGHPLPGAAAHLDRLFARTGHWPDFILPGFRW